MYKVPDWWSAWSTLNGSFILRFQNGKGLQVRQLLIMDAAHQQNRSSCVHSPCSLFSCSTDFPFFSLGSSNSIISPVMMWLLDAIMRRQVWEVNACGNQPGGVGRGPGRSWIPERAKGEVAFAVNEKRHAAHYPACRWISGHQGGVMPASPSLGLCRRFSLRLARTKSVLFYFRLLFFAAGLSESRAAEFKADGSHLKKHLIDFGSSAS